MCYGILIFDRLYKGVFEKMKKIGLMYDPLFLKHKNGPNHPESPERLKSILKMLKETGFEKRLIKIDAPSTTKEQIISAHSEQLYEQIKKTKERSFTKIDEDTSANRYSFDAAVKGAGGFIESLSLIDEGALDIAFALPRPPGHHAERDRAMGFCLFNHIAIGAAHLLSKGYKRIFILDWDVHHGNGTQNIFYERNEVLYLSIHQFPFYPGTGSLNEVGKRKGEGFTVNIPLPAMMNDHDYLYVFEQVITPVITQYDPELILISAGFDPYIADPLGGMEVTETGFAAMTRFVMDYANKHCGGKLAFLLEGGYNVSGLYSITKLVFEELFDINLTRLQPLEPSPGCELAIESVIETYATYWNF